MEYVSEKYKHSQATSKVITCTLEVYKILQNGFQEVIYQRALSKEMQLQGIKPKGEKEIDIY